MDKTYFIACLGEALYKAGFIVHREDFVGTLDQDTLTAYNLSKYQVRIHWESSFIRIFQWINPDPDIAKGVYLHIYTIDFDGKEIEVRNGSKTPTG